MYFYFLNCKGAVRLLQGVDKSKDQTFFLATVCQASLPSPNSFSSSFLISFHFGSTLQAMLRDTIFPVGGLSKKEVRDIAVKAGLQRVARKKEVGNFYVTTLNKCVLVLEHRIIFWSSTPYLFPSKANLLLLHLEHGPVLCWRKEIQRLHFPGITNYYHALSVFSYPHIS